MAKKRLLELRLSENYGNTWICTEIRPAYRYEDDKRTDTVEGVIYRCLHAQALAEGLFDIKVLGKKPVVSMDDVPESGVKMTFENLSFTEWTDRRTGARRTSGRADDAVKA